MHNEDALATIRAESAVCFIAGLWLHLPILLCVGWLNGTLGWGVEALAVLFCAAATIAWRVEGAGPNARLTIAVASVGMVSLLVLRAAGPLQTDMHMYYFAVFAMLAAFCDWRIIVVAAAATAAHHLALNFLAPALVFPDGANFGRVVLHAGIVIVECAVLVWLTSTLSAALARTAEALAGARAATAAAEAIGAREGLKLVAETEAGQVLAGVVRSFEQSIRGSLALVGTATREVVDQAGTLRRTAATSLADTDRMSGIVEEATASIESVVAASSGMAASIHAVIRRIAESSAIAKEAVLEAGRTNTTIEGLAAAASQIGAVVNLINGIASQTNLLALNATIEAARAGEAGKGFAVVATEVKNLASQTARAIEKISAQIEGMQSATKQAVEAIGGIGRTIGSIDAITAGIAGEINQQGEVVEEIGRDLRVTALKAQDLSTGVGQVERSAEATCVAASRIAERSRDVNDKMSGMRTEIETFLGRLSGAGAQRACS